MLYEVITGRMDAGVEGVRLLPTLRHHPLDFRQRRRRPLGRQTQPQRHRAAGGDLDSVMQAGLGAVEGGVDAGLAVDEVAVEGVLVKAVGLVRRFPVDP